MIKMRKAVRFFTVLINLAVILLCIIAGYYIFKLPDRYYVTEGTSLNIPARFDIETVREEPAQVLNTKVSPLCEQYTLKLFGLIPLKEVSVQPVDVPVLVPGGNPFGIKLSPAALWLSAWERLTERTAWSVLPGIQA